MKIIAVRLALLVAVWAVPATGWASIMFCNQSSSRAWIAIAYVPMDAPGTTANGDVAVAVKGWMKVAPGECGSVSDIDPNQYTVYYYARTPARTSWGGDSMLCVSTKSFSGNQ